MYKGRLYVYTSNMNMLQVYVISVICLLGRSNKRLSVALVIGIDDDQVIVRPYHVSMLLFLL